MMATACPSFYILFLIPSLLKTFFWQYCPIEIRDRQGTGLYTKYFCVKLDKWNSHSKCNYIVILKISWGLEGLCDAMFWILQDWCGMKCKLNYLCLVVDYVIIWMITVFFVVLCLWLQFLQCLQFFHKVSYLNFFGCQFSCTEKLSLLWKSACMRVCKNNIREGYLIMSRILQRNVTYFFI